MNFTNWPAPQPLCLLPLPQLLSSAPEPRSLFFLSSPCNRKSQSGVPLAITQSTANGLGVGSARPDKIGDPKMMATTIGIYGATSVVNSIIP